MSNKRLSLLVEVLVCLGVYCFLTSARHRDAARISARELARIGGGNYLRSRTQQGDQQGHERDGKEKE